MISIPNPSELTLYEYACGECNERFYAKWKRDIAVCPISSDQSNLIGEVNAKETEGAPLVPNVV